MKTHKKNFVSLLPQFSLFFTTFTITILALPAPLLLANVVGSDTQNFNPSSNGIDFVTVQASETLAPGVINLGFFLNYAANSLPYFDRADGSRQSRLKISDRLLSADINIGYGILPGWDIGLSLPYLLHQQSAKDGFRGQFASTGLTELRFNSKLHLVGNEKGGLAAIASVNLNQIQDNPYTGRDAGPTFNAELAGDRKFGILAGGLNFGYRWRDPGKPLSFENTNDGSIYPVSPIQNQWIWSGALSAMIPDTDTKVIGEVFGAVPVRKSNNQSNRLSSAAESLLGIKHSLRDNLDLHGGIGTELQHGLASPDWRVYLGVNWNTGGKRKAPAPAPQPAVFGTPTKEESITIHDILFEFDSDNMVLKGSAEVLSKLAKYLNQAPVFKKLIIEGHTDSIGADAYNKDLSLRRAQTIRRWLITRHKLDGAKTQAVGKGESEPIANNGNYQGRQMNRRVVFHIYR